MTADRPTPDSPDASVDPVERLRRALDTVVAATPAQPAWDDVLRRANGGADLRLAPAAPARRGPRRIAVLAAAAVVVAVALATGLTTIGGSDRDTDRGLEVGRGTPEPIGPRLVPDPLPEGWEVEKVTSSTVDLSSHLVGPKLTCPCIVAQWTDGQGRTATYRASRDWLPARETWQKPVDLGGRANHTLGICPICDYAGDVGETLLWATASGRAELTATGLDRSSVATDPWFAAGPGLALAQAVAGADGAVVNRIEGWTPLTEPLRIDQPTTPSTTVALRTAQGRSLTYQVTTPGFLRSRSTTIQPPEVPDALRPVLRSDLVLSDGSFLLAPWPDADVLVVPGEPDQAATTAELRTLVEALRTASPAEWVAFLDAAGLNEPEAPQGAPVPATALAGLTPALPVANVQGDAHARVLPEPLPPGWSVIDVTETETVLDATCPCRLAQWRSPDGDLLTYREQAEPFPDADGRTSSVDLGGGTTATFDQGSKAEAPDATPSDQRLRWPTATGHAELVLAATDQRPGPTWGIDLTLARAVAASRGTQVPASANLTPLGPPLELSAPQTRTSASLVQLRTASGSLVSLRTSPAAVSRWPVARGTWWPAFEDGAVLIEAAPSAFEGDGLGDVPGLGGVGPRAVAIWDGAEATVAPVGSREPGRRDEALPANAAEVEQLAGSLRLATDAEWDEFLAAHD